jgi:hypothetical protein
VLLVHVKVQGALNNKQLLGSEVVYGSGHIEGAGGADAFLMQMFHNGGSYDERIVPNPLVLSAADHSQPGDTPGRLDQATIDYVIPFRPDLRTIYLSDNVPGLPHTMFVTNVQATFDAFCASNASDPDCIARADTEAPSVSWAAPAPGPLNAQGIPSVVLSVTGTYTLVADATDNVGNPVVTFSNAVGTLCVVEAPPYECDWSARLGLETIRVSAWDAAGNADYQYMEVLVVALPES